MNDLEHKIREDLVAAGFDPDKYLVTVATMPRLCKGETEGSTDACYHCEQCPSSRFLWNLRKTSNGWICVDCLGRGTEWLSDPPDGWSMEEALDV